MSYSDKYRAIIKPVPTIFDGKISWGWEVALTDKFDDQKYNYNSVDSFASAEEALKDGGTTMLLWMKALDKVKELNVQEINLDAELPEPTPEPEPEANPETEEKPDEEAPEKETPEAETKPEAAAE